ncbi:MAG: hypothetical protein JHD02_10300 [Thermoleophilaceae bacterium]|nr:hypothetical protein [Thermoleophilaceae bacterium]
MPEETKKTNESRRSALPWIIGPVLAFVVLVGLVLATGTPSSAALMKTAASSFGEVSRGNFLFKIAITPQGAENATPSSIELSGPFEIIPGKPLPKAKITYKVSSGGRSQVVTLLTTGDKAYTVIKGQAYELPPSATKDLQSATKDLAEPGKGKGLSGIQLNFDKWLINPQVAAGRDIDGTATWRTTAGVNVVAALKDLTSSAGALGGITGQNVPALKESDLAEVKKGIKDASVVVFVGRYDRIIRLLDLTMDFTTPSNLTAAAGGVTGGRMNMVVGISNPNQPVDVEAPKSPLPYSALQSLVSGQSSQTGTSLDDGLGQ